MPNSNYWILPDGIQEELPNEAEKLEMLRRNLIDMYQNWGYRLALPPLVEFMDSLRAGSGTLLDLQTIKITDTLSGRLMGIRADMTPQVARIDAHRLKTDGINRLCYYGRVLRTKSTHPSGSRSPLQVGAELFGHAGLDSDYEIINLMLETLKTCKVDKIIIDIGHVQIFRGLAQQAGLSEQEEKLFFEMLQRKSIPEIQAWLNEKNINTDVRAMLLALPTLNGSTDIINEARSTLAKASNDVQDALSYLSELVKRIQTTWSEVSLHIDLSELRGYTYHNGIVYAAYSQSTGRELARGGRYDDIGERFGNARPATGFSCNLCQLAELGTVTTNERTPIHAPASEDLELIQLINELRNQGEIVIQALQGQAEATNMDRVIQMQDGKWMLTSN
jgi:ATP phosphoribosyltransferase regulatory subunit